MFIVEVAPRADALYGLIQRGYRADAAKQRELEVAYYALVMELRRGHPSIWFIPSDRPEDQDIFVLYHPPLKVYFRKIHDQRIGVVGFEEIAPEV